jgi:hypothetical protein
MANTLKPHNCPHCNCPTLTLTHHAELAFLATLTPDPDGRINTNDLHSAYAQWKYANKLGQTIGQNKFTRLARARGYQLTKRGSLNWLLGYRLPD